MVGHPNYTVILNTVINDTPKIAKEILMNKCLIFRIAVKYIARHEKNKSSQCLSVSNYIYIFCISTNNVQVCDYASSDYKYQN